MLPLCSKRAAPHSHGAEVIPRQRDHLPAVRLLPSLHTTPKPKRQTKVLKNFSTNGVSGQGPKRASIFTRFLQSRCPYNVPTIQISQATSLHSPLWVTGTKIWNVSIGKPQDTQPPSPQYFQAVLTRYHQCGGNTAPLWWGRISQHGNPKQVLHPSRTACPDPAAFFQLPGSFMTLAWYKLLIQGLKQRDNQTPRKR